MRRLRLARYLALAGSAAVLLAIGLVAAGGANRAPVPIVNNNPVPMPLDLEARLILVLRQSGIGLEPADPIAPPISATRATEIAHGDLRLQLRANNVPMQGPWPADGLVRLRYLDPQRAPAPVNAWFVAYRWKPGVNCESGGGPGPCPMTSVYIIDDRSGEIIHIVSL